MIKTLGWRWALGEARTLRTATKGAPGTQDRTSEMVTCEDGIPTRGAWAAVGPRLAVIQARKTRGNRGNIGITPPRSMHFRVFLQSGDWRLALGDVVGNVKGNEVKDDRRSPRRSCCPSTTQLQRDRRPKRGAWSAGVAAVVMGGATMWVFGARLFGTFWQRTRGVLVMAHLCAWTRADVPKPGPYQRRSHDVAPRRRLARSPRLRARPRRVVSPPFPSRIPSSRRSEPAAPPLWCMARWSVPACLAAVGVRSRVEASA